MPDTFMPLVTGLFLVIAGILVGYFLWFRDRTQEAVTLRKLRDEIDDLQKSLERQKASAADAASELTIREGKLQLLEQLRQDMLSERQQFQQSRIELETQLVSQQKQLEAFQEQHRQESEQRQQLAEQRTAEKEQALAFQLATENRWREESRQLQTELAARHADVHHLARQNEQRSCELEEAKSTIRDLREELESQRSLRETAFANVNGLEKDYISLETSLRNQTELLQESRSQTAVAESAREIAERSLTDLRNQIKDQKLLLENLEKARAEASQAQQECNQLREQFDALSQHCEQLRSQAAHAQQAIDKANNDSLVLATRSHNQASTIRYLQRHVEEYQASLRAGQAGQLAAEQALVDSRQQLESQAQDSRRLESLNEELAAQAQQQEKELIRSHSVVRQLEQNLLQKITENGHYEKQLRQLGEERVRQAKKMEVLEASTSQQLAKIRLRVEQLQQEAMQHQARITTLMRERKELRILIGEFEEQQEESEHLLELQRTEIQTRLQLTIAQRDQAFEKANRGRQEIEQLKEVVASQQLTIAELQSLSADVVTFSAQQEVEDAARGGKTRIDIWRGRIFTVPPQSRDDLKRIDGIDDTLERRLNECGVYTYLQIAEWDEAVVKEFSRLLGCAEQIERDHWLEQAKTLQAQTRRHAA